MFWKKWVIYTWIANKLSVIEDDLMNAGKKLRFLVDQPAEFFHRENQTLR